MKLIEPVAQTGCDSVENWLTGRPYTKCREFYTLMRFIRKKSSPFHSPKNSEWLSLGLLGTGILLDLLGNQLWEIHQEFIEFFRCIVPNHRNKVYFICKLVLWFTMPPIKAVMHDCFFDTFPFFLTSFTIPFIKYNTVESRSYDDFHQWYANFFSLSLF